MLTAIIVIIVLVVAGFIGFLWIMSDVIETNQAKLAQARQELQTRFGEGDYHVELPDLRCFGIAWDTGTILIGESLTNPSVIPFSNVRGANVEVDGVDVTTSRSTTSTNRGSQMMGGAIGGLALGPAGLLVGGLSGSSTTTGRSTSQLKVKSVKLVVRIADREAPLRTYVFYDAKYGDGYEASSPIVQPALEKAAHYHALLTQIVEDRALAS